MTGNDKSSPIGVFDSGLGGISVLKRCVDMMPFENYIYYGDSLNAPYGTKPMEEVERLSFDVTDRLIELGVKGILVACNTATSAAVRKLRELHPDFPVVGIEPAIKPAALAHPGSMVLVMATEATLTQSKYRYLRSQYDRLASFYQVPCTGLMEFVEAGELSGDRLEAYLRDRLKDLPMERVGAIVLGCTHYPFISRALQEIVGDRIEIIDGSKGTAREMKRRLEGAGLLTDSKDYGRITLINSASDHVQEVFYDGTVFSAVPPAFDEQHKVAVRLLNMDIY